MIESENPHILSDRLQALAMTEADRFKANKYGETGDMRPNGYDYEMSPAPDWRDRLFSLVALSMFAWAVKDELIEVLRYRFTRR